MFPAERERVEAFDYMCCEDGVEDEFEDGAADEGVGVMSWNEER